MPAPMVEKIHVMMLEKQRKRFLMKVVIGSMMGLEADHGVRYGGGIFGGWDCVLLVGRLVGSWVIGCFVMDGWVDG